jgi:hypothetical protein
LGPEKSINYVLGAEFAPTGFLSGLDLQANWYSIKVSGVLDAHGANQTAFNDPTQRFSFILPSDLVSQPGGAACATANASPVACDPFQAMARSVLFNPNNASAQPAAQTLLYWINDGGVINHGTQLATGIDWTASYDWDWGDLGAWNVGIVGTYYLHNYLQGGPGEDKVDTWHETLSSIGGLAVEGVTEIPRMNYRARLGWSNGTWDITGFMNFTAHHHSTASAPPNVNNQCSSPGGTVPRGAFPCAITGYTGFIPSTYWFDLSIGYNTGDTVANDYLKNVQINLVINNIMNRAPPFSFDPGNGGHTPTAYDQQRGNNGRIIHFIVTKTW